MTEEADKTMIVADLPITDQHGRYIVPHPELKFYLGKYEVLCRLKFIEPHNVQVKFIFEWHKAVVALDEPISDGSMRRLGDLLRIAAQRSANCIHPDHVEAEQRFLQFLGHPALPFEEDGDPEEAQDCADRLDNVQRVLKLRKETFGE